jgi:hypothetical protein
MVEKNQSEGSWFKNALRKISHIDKDKSKSDSDNGIADMDCGIDATGKTLLGCLAKDMRPFEDDMMICVDKKDFIKKEAALRSAARDLGVKITIKRNVRTADIDDALCITVSKSARKKLIKGLS